MRVGRSGGRGQGGPIRLLAGASALGRGGDVTLSAGSGGGGVGGWPGGSAPGGAPGAGGTVRLLAGDASERLVANDSHVVCLAPSAVEAHAGHRILLEAVAVRSPTPPTASASAATTVQVSSRRARLTLEASSPLAASGSSRSSSNSGSEGQPAATLAAVGGSVEIVAEASAGQTVGPAVRVHTAATTANEVAFTVFDFKFNVTSFKCIL